MHRRAGREVERPAVVVGGIAVIERRHRQHRARSERANPREVHERVRFALDVRRARRLSLGSVGHLIPVTPEGGDEPQLVVRVAVEDQGPEAAQPGLAIVEDLGRRGRQPEVAPIARHARVVREPLRVTAEAELIVGLEVAARAQDDLRIVVTLEPGARNDVEHAVGAVAIFGLVAAAEHFEIIGVLGIELGADVGRDVRVRHRDAVHEPAHLVAATDVQLIVRHVRPGHEGRHHRQAVGSVRPGGGGDVGPAHERRRRGRRRVCGLRAG